jgi:hypothetical protein
MSLPEWIPADAWAGYVEMRKKAKKPMTPRAETMQIKALEKFLADGHDLTVILDQSTANNWTDLYEPKDRRQNDRRAGGLPQFGKIGNATAENAKEWLDQQAPSELEAKRRFATLFTGLADYYKSEISRAVLGLYWEGLKHIDYAAVEKACWAHTQNPDTGMFMPRVADLLKMVSGRTDDQAKVAWAKVDRAVRSVPGVGASVAFDDPLIHRVLADMGGWASLGGKSEDEWPFVAKEFENRYRGFRMRGEIPAYPHRLIGSYESGNSSSGQRTSPETYLIGNKEAAIATIQNGTAGPLLELGMVDVASLTAGTNAPRQLS